MKNLIFAAAALLAIPAFGNTGDERETPPPRPRPSVTRAPSSPPPAPSPRAPQVSSPASSASNPGRGGGVSRGRGSRSGGYGFGYGYGRSYGDYGYYRGRPYCGYGSYWPYSRFYGSYYRPYYPFGMTWYGAHDADTRSGYFDLDIKPKKAAVYVDGEYVGKASQFDGYPGYLPLSEGTHQVVLHYDGRETVARRVQARSGPVRRLKIDLEKGAAVAPEEFFEPIVVTPEAPIRRAGSVPGPAKASEAPGAPERRASLDLRGEPGRFLLEVVPSDASVYLDGRFLGSGTELSRLHSGMMVDAGEHVVEVLRPGFETERVEFVVAAGEEARVSVDLEGAREGQLD